MPEDNINTNAERLVLYELLQVWHAVNYERFESRLKPPVLALHDGSARLGYWKTNQRLISLSRELVFNSPWSEVLHVFKHEMIHQFLDEVENLRDFPPHNHLFQLWCRELGIEEYRVISPEGTAPTPEQRILQKIRKCLSLAGSPNPNEAENAMRHANRLMLKWNIDEKKNGEDGRHVVLQLNEPARVPGYIKLLSCLLSKFFFVEAIWVRGFNAKTLKKGQFLEICGLPENIKIAEYVYRFLLDSGNRFWAEYKKSHPNGRKNHYLYGLIQGFYEKLELQERVQSEGDMALIWTGDANLEKWFSRRYPRVRSFQSTKMRANKNTFDAGRKQGSKMTLHRPMEGKSGLTQKKYLT